VLYIKEKKIIIIIKRFTTIKQGIKKCENYLKIYFKMILKQLRIENDYT